jgi:hypothetical protein
VLKAVVQAASEQLNTPVIRRALGLSTIYYRGVEVNKEKVRFPLIHELIDCACWRSESFWEAAILESLEEEGRNILRAMPDETPAETIERERSIKLGQLAGICNLMIMLLIKTVQVRILVGKFCLSFFLTDEQNESLSKTITQIYRQVRQLIEGQLLPPFGHNAVAGIKDPS